MEYDRIFLDRKEKDGWPSTNNRMSLEKMMKQNIF